jgi:hypothetical protein
MATAIKTAQMNTVETKGSQENTGVPVIKETDSAFITGSCKSFSVKVVR